MKSSPSACLVLLSVICTLLVGDVAARTVNGPPEDRWDLSPLQSSDLIVRAHVVSVADAEVSSEEYWMHKPGTDFAPPIQVALVTLRVAEVLRGPAQQDDVRLFVMRDPAIARVMYAVGSEVIACLYYHPRLKSYYQAGDFDCYSRSTNGWRLDLSGDESESLTDQDLRNLVNQSSIESISEGAELIVEGQIESVATELVRGPDNTSGELVRIKFRVEDTKKGRVVDNPITLTVMTRGLYWPEWRRWVPMHYSIGQHWLCFLKKNQMGWYPFAGSDGFFQVLDNTLIYAERVEYWRSKSKVETVIKSTKTEEPR